MTEQSKQSTIVTNNQSGKKSYLSTMISGPKPNTVKLVRINFILVKNQNLPVFFYIYLFLFFV